MEETGKAAPSRAGRTATAALLLFGFYGVTLAVSLVLLAMPIAELVVAGRFHALLIFFCWIPAVMLLRGLLVARPPRYEAPRELIDRAEAPELYAMVEELAAALRTAPPTEIYLTGEMSVTVVEHDGERALGIGAPLLASTIVTDLRAITAKELAQFAMGSTTLVVWARAAFGAALVAKTAISSRPGPVAVFSVALSGFVAKACAKVFFRVMRSSDQRVALAADRAAAEIVGTPVLENALERLGRLALFYDFFARRSVPEALAAGGVPNDMATLLAKNFGKETPPAAALVDIDLDAFLVTEVLERASLSRRAVKHEAWADLPRLVLVPSIAKRAALSMKRLSLRYPGRHTLVEMFKAVVDHREPEVDLATLLSGALIESGAQVEGWLGVPHPIFAWRGLEVVPELVARDLGALTWWARELGEAPAASGIVKTQRGAAISAAS